MIQNANVDTVCSHSVHGAKQKHDVWIGIHSRCKLSIEMADMVKSSKHNGKHALLVKPLLFKAFHSYVHRVCVCVTDIVNLIAQDWKWDLW